MAADTFGNRGFGLREIDITPYNGSTLDTANRVVLPVAMTLSFKPTQEEKELRGDDVTVEIVTYNKQVEWSLEAGGVSMDVWTILSGGTLAAAGTTPNATKTLTAKGTDSAKYFRIRGRSVQANGTSGTIVELLYCKVTAGPEGEVKGDEYFMTKCSGKGIPHPTSSEIWKLIEAETAAAFA
jgi:hypothetical protein